MGNLGKILAVALASILLAACISPPAAPKPAAPTPGAPKAGIPSLSVVSPAEGTTISGGQVAVSIKVESFTIKGAGGANRPNEGHMHMKLDGGAVTMVYGDSHTLSGVPPGKHTLEVELVNNDHSPFSPPVKKTVSFSTGPGGAAPAPTTPPKSGY